MLVGRPPVQHPFCKSCLCVGFKQGNSLVWGRGGGQGQAGCLACAQGARELCTPACRGHGEPGHGVGAPRASLPGETNPELKLPGPVVGTAGTAPGTWGAPAQVTFTEAAVLPVGAVTWWPACDAAAPRATRRCRWCTCPAGARDLSAQCPWPQPAPRFSSPQTLALAEQSRAPSSSSSLRVQRSGEVTFRDPAPTTVQPGPARPALSARAWGPDSGDPWWPRNPGRSPTRLPGWTRGFPLGSEPPEGRAVCLCSLLCGRNSGLRAVYRQRPSGVCRMVVGGR